MTYPLLLFSALFTAWLVWSAIQRPDRRRLAGRIVASVVAVASVLLVLFPPSIPRKVNPSEAILLTEGFNRDSLSRMLGVNPEVKPLVFSYRLKTNRATEITNVAAWRRDFPRIRKLHLLGYGLPEFALPALDSLPTAFHPSPLPEGVARVHWTKRVNPGDFLRVSGQYRTNGKAPTRLYLSVAGIARDSLEIRGDDSGVAQPFQLRHQPKETGKYRYQLQVKRGGKLLTEEKVPVEVTASEPLRVLVLTAFPSFEIKFLKNFLAARQSELAIRTAISQGKFRTEWLNAPETDLSRLSAALLRNFDLVVADAQSLQKLSSPEERALQRALNDEGLGLLLLPAEVPFDAKLPVFRDFGVEKTTQKDARVVRVQWPGGEDRAPETTVPPYGFALADRVKPLVTGADGRVLVAAQATGWGKVAISLLTETHRWALAGKTGPYAAYWSFLTTELAKKQYAAQRWSFPDLPFVHQPLTPRVSTSLVSEPPPAEIRPAVGSSSTVLRFRQENWFGPPFRATYWPEVGGWHAARTPELSPHFFYVFAASDWKTVQYAGRMTSTRRFVQQQPTARSTSREEYTPQEIPPVVFFLFFLLSSGFLWLEEKL
ncbi:MAG: hypothetical protein H7Z75_01345 [Ferruginibacter sp.]|nr:hypothetical protein [Cytophagales bacterium]